MDSRQLIERMLAEGRISPDQAEQLRAGSTPGSARATSSPPRRRNPATLMVFIAAVVAVLVFAGLLWGQGGGEPPPVQDVGEWMSEQDETGDRTAMLSRNLALALFILVPLALVTLVLGWSYNSLIRKEEAVFSFLLPVPVRTPGWRIGPGYWMKNRRRHSTTTIATSWRITALTTGW